MLDAQYLTTVYGSTACYWDSFTFLYVDDVRASQKTHLWASTVCYGESFTLLQIYVNVALAEVAAVLVRRSSLTQRSL
jgi:hypothetical protein